jgi:uridine kinase
MPTEPSAVLAHVAGEIERLQQQAGRVLVAVDGPDAAGKTTFAAQLAEATPSKVIQASADDFQFPRAVRSRRGKLSAEGYYLDAFDHDTLTARLLVPFRDGASRVAVSAWSYRRDVPDERSIDVPERAVLIVDGVFLQRPELRDIWSLVIYVTAPTEVTFRRGVERDAGEVGHLDRVTERYRERYLPGQALYRADVDPEAACDVLIDNTDPTRPLLLRA